mmetsp:Transcript_19322/g.23071  ORF Transcript_19322/g.23071 Transcript_19322/m.23071 type:complete len:185 (+) Transcript_19322:2-556(+)
MFDKSFPGSCHRGSVGNQELEPERGCEVLELDVACLVDVLRWVQDPSPAVIMSQGDDDEDAAERPRLRDDLYGHGKNSHSRRLRVTMAEFEQISCRGGGDNVDEYLDTIELTMMMYCVYPQLGDPKQKLVASEDVNDCFREFMSIKDVELYRLSRRASSRQLGSLWQLIMVGHRFDERLEFWTE